MKIGIKVKVDIYSTVSLRKTDFLNSSHLVNLIFWAYQLSSKKFLTNEIMHEK